MRDALSDCLVSSAIQDPRLILLTGDHGYALFDSFRATCAAQYLNAGIAEQNMIGMAAGLAKAGFTPIVYGLSAFVPIRVLEQIKLDVAHDGLPILMLGDGAGFVYSHLGTSHHCTEDLACIRAIPNIITFSPADAAELKLCFNLALTSRSTSYLRIGKSDRGTIHQNAITDYAIGDILPIHSSVNSRLSVLATGSMVSTALRIARKYKTIDVWSTPTIKPINQKQLIEIASRTQNVVTLEEHSIHGGLGAAVCEILSEHCPTRVVRFGVNDRFSQLCGSYDYLLKEHALDEASIERRLLETFRFIS